MALGLLGRDRLDPGLRHLGVGLVVELGHVARHALEQHDGAGARVAHRVREGGEVERIRRHAHAPDPSGTAADRRDERDLVAGADGLVGVRVLAVDGHDALARAQRADRRVRHRRQHVGHARRLRQLDLEPVGAGALAQAGEEADGDAHAADARRTGMPLVSSDDSVLVVIDVQPGFAANPAMDDAERAAAAATVDRIAWLAAYAAELAVPAVVVEENPARNGTTDARILERLDARAHVKPTFGIGGCPAAIEALTASGRGTAVLVGFESDVCVAQSAIALLDRGLRVAVPDDGVYTSGEPSTAAASPG